MGPQQEEQAKIFKAHLEMIADESLQEGISEAIFEEHQTLCQAIDQVCARFQKRLLRSKDDLIRQRAADIQDIRNRLLRCCLGIDDCDLSRLPEPVILAAWDLLPSDTAALDTAHILGIVTEIGGVTSHSAIIARSYGIPQITGIDDLLNKVSDGLEVILDGDKGLLIAQPDARELNDYQQQRQAFLQQKEAEGQFLSAQPCTADGVRIEIGLNIGNPSPQALEKQQFTDYVGLFRSEFLYMEGSAFPTEEEQLQAYKTVLQTYGQRPVTLRTLDIGGDKTLPYFSLPLEDNPFLGNRALRFCLSNPEIFNTQLRAALRASVYGNLWIMLPMVGSLEDIRRGRQALEQAKSQLRAQGIPFSEQVRLGVMIEIPSIAMMADSVAKEVDFASIGSNDLCQYLLAADRLNPAVQSYYQSYHPALFRLIGYTAEQFARAGKPLSICGELGGDALAAPALVGLGVHKLSMNPSSIGKIKKCLSSFSLPQMQALAQDVLRCATAAQAEQLLKEFSAR